MHCVKKWNLITSVKCYLSLGVYSRQNYGGEPPANKIFYLLFICKYKSGPELNKVEEIRGVVEMRNDELFVPVATMRGGRNCDDVLLKIEKMVSYYNMKEAIIIYELALCKANLDEARSNVSNRKRPVKDIILEYCLSPNNSAC